MTNIIILLFVLGYIAIATEHSLKLDKTVPALLTAAILWALLAIGFHEGWFSIIDPEGHVYNFLKDGPAAEEGFHNTLMHHLGKTAEILVFLTGAMTIVEIIDLHRGFEVLKDYVKTNSRRKLLWIMGFLAFFLSAVIDNLTATIVLVTLLRKLVKDRNTRLWYAGLIVIAANAGGAWSPIGDVTTTMLWIAKKVTAAGLIEHVFIPSVLNLLVPFGIASFLSVFNGTVKGEKEEADWEEQEKLLSSKTMLYLGLGMILFVPVFKTVTHLPPYLGMMLSLGVVWLVSEYIHPEEDFTEERKHLYSAHKALSRIEMSSILFFLGILLAVGALESLVYGSINGVEMGSLRYMAEVLQQTLPNVEIVVVLLGILSAIVDNVPLVAAAMGMFDYPIDHIIWHMIAYSAGTGGSILIIGSAAGVAAMGMEKINFFWYMKKISWLAFLGFLAGFIAFWVEKLVAY
ncbi:MAG TPA: sodium:proton antiporter [Flavobacteriales bacterium]|jgi:Na+/H+ antiporter NhaD/arsenite permease-like protein|nr:sodium:proton antiporter [Flavobacteriales bacterium]